MLSVYDLNHDQFKSLLARKCTPQDIFNWSPEIYGYLSGLFQEDCSDSVLREWAFQWASDELGLQYANIYNLWLKGAR